MRKKYGEKRTNKRNNANKKSRNKKLLLPVLVLTGIVLVGILLTIKTFIETKTQERPYNSPEIEFKKEGQLSFYKDQSSRQITTIEIEIAEDDYERALGLMHRYILNDNHGMLFIMNNEEQQSFWMKNTYVSLDIIYLNDNLEVVKVHKYTQALSEQPIASVVKSKYVVEVNGGFCDKFNIKEGDFIKYERITAANKPQ